MNRVNSYREFILYSCRNLKLLQKCNVVLNYAETFYKSNVNCTFLYKNKSKTQLEHVSFWGGWREKVILVSNIKPARQIRFPATRQAAFFHRNVRMWLHSLCTVNIWHTSQTNLTTKCPYQTCTVTYSYLKTRRPHFPEAMRKKTHSCVKKAESGRTEGTFTFLHAMQSKWD